MLQTPNLSILQPSHPARVLQCRLRAFTQTVNRIGPQVRGLAGCSSSSGFVPCHFPCVSTRDPSRGFVLTQAASLGSLPLPLCAPSVCPRRARVSPRADGTAALGFVLHTGLQGGSSRWGGGLGDPSHTTVWFSSTPRFSRPPGSQEREPLTWGAGAPLSAPPVLTP